MFFLRLAITEGLGTFWLTPRLIVDCSHGNSAKDYRRQAEVAADLADQIAGGSGAICGVMLESHLVEGKQALGDEPKNLRYGQSVTDACIGWETTESLLREAHEMIGPVAAPSLVATC